MLIEFARNRRKCNREDVESVEMYSCSQLKIAEVLVEKVGEAAIDLDAVDLLWASVIDSYRVLSNQFEIFSSST